MNYRLSLLSVVVSSTLMTMSCAQAAKPSKQNNKKVIAAQAKHNVGVTAKLGTLGLGLDVVYGINDKLNARFNANGLSYDREDEKDGLTANSDLSGQTLGGLVDYHPTGGGFRLSAGLYNNRNALKVKATGSSKVGEPVELGDKKYEMTNATLNTEVNFKSTAPYLGLGYGNSVSKEGKWGFSLDVGVLFQGAPKASISASGMGKDTATGQPVNLATDSIVLAEIDKEEKEINDKMKDFKFYPVVSLGVSYKIK